MKELKHKTYEELKNETFEIPIDDKLLYTLHNNSVPIEDVIDILRKIQKIEPFALFEFHQEWEHAEIRFVKNRSEAEIQEILKEQQLDKEKKELLLREKRRKEYEKLKEEFDTSK